MVTNSLNETSELRTLKKRSTVFRFGELQSNIHTAATLGARLQFYRWRQLALSAAAASAPWIFAKTYQDQYHADNHFLGPTTAIGNRTPRLLGRISRGGRLPSLV